MSSARTRGPLVGATVVALAVGALVTAGPATAEPVTPEPVTAETAAAQAPILQAGRFVDSDDAPTDGTVEAQVTFRVPVVRCAAVANTADFFALYANGENPAAEFSPSSSLYVRVGCQGGVPEYTTTVRQSGDRSGGAAGTVAPGDLLRLTVTTSATATQATLADLTTGTTLRQRGTRFTALDSVQVSVQAGDGTGARYPRFRTVSFTKASVRGVPWGQQPGYPFTQPTGTASDPIQPGPISADGTAFAFTWPAPAA